MKRAYWIRLIVLVLALYAMTATSTLAKTNKTTSKADTGTAKKKTVVDKDKDDKAKEKDEEDESILQEKDKGDAKTKDKVEIHPDLTEFYAEVAEVVQLDEEGQKKLLKLQEMKKKELDTFDEKADKIIVRLENDMDRAKKEKQREEIREKLKKIELRRENIQQKYDNQALRVINADQRIAWNTYELWEVISPELEFDDEELLLSDEQVEKSKTICGAIAKKMGAKARIAQNASVQKMAIAQIGRQVLDQKQRAAYTRQQRRKRLRDENGDKDGEKKKTIIRRGR